MDAIDFGPSAQIKMATIKLFKMYAIDLDTPYERDIFQTVSPMTSNLKYNRISPIGRMLLILAICLKQDGSHRD